MHEIDNHYTDGIREQGFTIAEIIVTLVVVSLFLTLFSQTLLVQQSQRVTLAQQAKASDIAYSNLRKVTSRTALTGQTCTTDGWDLTAPAFGYTVEPSSDEQVKTLGAGSVQTLWAYPSNGCSGTALDKYPIRVISTVRYKANGSGTENVVVHASYIP